MTVTAEEAKILARNFNREEVMKRIRDLSSEGYYLGYFKYPLDKELIKELETFGYTVREASTYGSTQTMISWECL
jgi:hypothetical protein